MIILFVGAVCALFCFTIGYFCRELVEWCNDRIGDASFDQEWADAQDQWRRLHEA